MNSNNNLYSNRVCDISISNIRFNKKQKNLFILRFNYYDWIKQNINGLPIILIILHESIQILYRTDLTFKKYTQEFEEIVD